MIVETAAKINAMKFFTIIFATSVGRNVFKSFKNEEVSLEKVAKENGHEELACFLEQRHSMYVRIDRCTVFSRLPEHRECLLILDLAESAFN